MVQMQILVHKSWLEHVNIIGNNSMHVHLPFMMHTIMQDCIIIANLLEIVAKSTVTQTVVFVPHSLEIVDSAQHLM